MWIVFGSFFLLSLHLLSLDWLFLGWILVWWERRAFVCLKLLLFQLNQPKNVFFQTQKRFGNLFFFGLSIGAAQPAVDAKNTARAGCLAKPPPKCLRITPKSPLEVTDRPERLSFFITIIYEPSVDMPTSFPPSPSTPTTANTNSLSCKHLSQQANKTNLFSLLL